MLYIIPIYAVSIEETIQVDGESGVAEYFLTRDSAATPSQKIIFAVASDFILNVLCGIVTVSLRGLYLRHVYRELQDGMYSNFCWGDETFARKYFS